MPADVGRLGIAIATRSFTCWRASRLSVPRLKKSVIADRPGTVFERITSRFGVEFSACSIGIVMSCSTSSVDIPRPSVCTSTNGGANSGKTSTGMFCTRVAPRAIMPTARATTMNRKCRLDLTIQRIIGSGSLPFDLELGPEQLLAADAHDPRARGRPGLEDDRVPVDVVDVDWRPHERQRRDLRVHPGAPVDPVDHRRVGDRLAFASALLGQLHAQALADVRGGRAVEAVVVGAAATADA